MKLKQRNTLRNSLRIFAGSVIILSLIFVLQVKDNDFKYSNSGTGDSLARTTTPEQKIEQPYTTHSTIDTDLDGVLDSDDLDDDNDGIPDADEGCNAIINEGVESTTFPSGYWAIMYYEGNEAIAGSSYGANNGSGGSGTKVFRGTSYIGVDQDTVTYSSNGSTADNRWSELETPTDPILPDNYVGASWTSSGNPWYQIELRRTILRGGDLSFGYDSSELLDDVLEVFVNGTRIFGHWPSGGGGTPDPRPGQGTGFTFALNAGDEVEIRFINLGWIGGLSFTFAAPDELPVISKDTDSDGISDCLDLDSDNDGIPDLIELGAIDSNGDGRLDNATDTDGDGLADVYDNDDTDGPDVAGCTIGLDCDLSASTSVLLDTDANGSNDNDRDFDGDGMSNWTDLDADADGILDIIEAGGTDSNGDGQGDNTTDVDQDGYYDMFDPNASDGLGGSGTNGTPHMTVSGDDADANLRPEYSDAGGNGDADTDDVPNFLDVDADNDGIFDIYEAQGSTSYTPPTGSDDDRDGIDNAYDDDDSNWGGAGAAGLSPVNTDISSDAIPDYLDTDSDEDGATDLAEAWDSSGDPDHDPDGSTGSCTTDSDGDGYADCFDSNNGDASIWTTALTPPDDDGTGGSTSSIGVDIMSSNTLDDVFPNNVVGSDVNEPDWRDFGTALPVQWLDFAIKKQGENAILDWSTASEINADYFEIERSPDGRMFQRVGTEAAQGNTQEVSTYQFKDQSIPYPENRKLYYRLKQIDKNGTVDYSKVLELKLGEKIEIAKVNLSPNPAHDFVNIAYSQQSLERLPLQIYSTSGQKIYEGALTERQGKLRINVQNWLPGTYFLKVEDERNIVLRFMVVN